MALLVDHSTKKHGDVSKNESFLVGFVLSVVEQTGGI